MKEKRTCSVFYCKAPFTVDLEVEQDYIHCPLCRVKIDDDLVVDAYTFTNASMERNIESEDGSYGFNHKINYSINKR